MCVRVCVRVVCMLPGGLWVAGSEGIGGNVGGHVSDIGSSVQGMN